MTNADFIRNMADEELAKFLYYSFSRNGRISFKVSNYKDVEMNDNVRDIAKWLGREYKANE